MLVIWDAIAPNYDAIVMCYAHACVVITRSRFPKYNGCCKDIFPKVAYGGSYLWISCHLCAVCGNTCIIDTTFRNSVGLVDISSEPRIALTPAKLEIFRQLRAFAISFYDKTSHVILTRLPDHHARPGTAGLTLRGSRVQRRKGAGLDRDQKRKWWHLWQFHSTWQCRVLLCEMKRIVRRGSEDVGGCHWKIAGLAVNYGISNTYTPVLV